MKLARSTYYYRRRRSAAERVVLHDRIAELTAEFPRYGYRRVTYQLRAEGVVVNHKAVARMMRESGLQVRPLRRFVRTTDSDHESPIFANLAQGLIPTEPNQLWVADLTYVAIAAGFVYLADPRCLVTPGGGLWVVAPHRYAAGAGGIARSGRSAPAPVRLHPSFGPGRPIRIRDLSPSA